ncbi:ATP-dependent Clp protease ATP-binding subunit ClpC [Paraburkholderia eburnea]|uniref:ATP-dependent Clp protease ATP-binding subunit ClpC n=1 Tax=Paraburkholderia eburnea TaxID=1189126 RepID=A0A2S4MK53_9BURK|nr:ATP-dependent Clp protease ATP-binding subunit [Paraburkholderia eburnea]POR55051.1 ATP-dependent Clp protease ATP-binding subunit ClpC [Paraburkholderia eburnea]PRZ24350.1 ATP-dependent Clp protease ATP-binding subunit ClpC [Paraburkholderia eburnea]
MAQINCDICGVRPASVRVAVLQDGRRRFLDVCDYHYGQLTRHQRTLSPLESLFRAAQQAEAAPGQGPTPTMEAGDSAIVERHFSEVARELLQRAAERALQFGRREVDTEHLLYELAGNDAGAAILTRLGIEAADVRAFIDANAQKRDPIAAGDEGRVAVSPRLKGALDRAFLISRELGHSSVAPEHLLLGLAQVQDSFAGHLLARYGVTPQKVLQRLVEAQGDPKERPAAKAPSPTPQLDQYSRDLTALASEGKLDPVIGRSSEIETVVEVLARRRKNNPVLIGEPGVGKTAIAEGLAQRMLNGDVPESLRGRRLVELDVNGLIAGAKYRGEFEERVKGVMEEISVQRENLVLFIDEVHMIVGAGQGGNEGGLDIANVFKPAMARGELNLIGATTLSEYQKYIEKDAALERRFQPVFVAEPSVDQTINILRGLRDKLEVHHHVTIRDDALVSAAELSDRYITGRFLPDKAIDLVDQAAARVHLSTTSRPAAILELEAELAQLKREQDYAATRKNFERAHALDEPIADKEKSLVDATGEWKGRLGSVTSDVTTEQVAEIVSKLTGVPVTQLTAEERTRLLEMEKRLHERVIGQQQAIVAVSDAVRRSRAGLRRGRRPTAVFLFLGPTGVGKTELAKALADVVFGDEDAIVRIDMSEYMERHAVSRLIGSPPGYVGHDEGGQLTERVRRRPYCVILLDEIEKAHPDVYNVLLQVFDDGRLTDGKGRVVDFSNTVVIATSNLGSESVSGQKRSGPGFLASADASMQGAVLGELRQHFRPEFLNRIDDIIIFKPLTDDELRAIVRLQLEQVQRMARSQDIELTFDESVVDFLAADGYQPEYGARELKRQIQQSVENELAKEMLKGEVTEGAKVVCRYDAGRKQVVFAV